jgi:hypothetical protein
VALLQGTGWTILLKEGLRAAKRQAGLLQVCLELPPPAFCVHRQQQLAVAVVRDTVAAAFIVIVPWRLRIVEERIGTANWLACNSTQMAFAGGPGRFRTSSPGYFLE